MEEEYSLLEHLSSSPKFGNYQIFAFFLSCIAAFVSAPTYVDWNIIGKILPHRCFIKGCDNNESTYYSSFNNFTIPEVSAHSASPSWSRCEMYERSSSSIITNDSLSSSCTPQDFEDVVVGCDSWVYDRSLFTTTTVSEFDLTCGNSWLVPLAGSLNMGGMLLGAITLGNIADKFGRKIGILISTLLVGTGGLVSALSPNYYTFLVMRFLSGAGAVGLFQISFIFSIELVNSTWRSFVGLMIEIPFALGEAYVGLVAYFIRDWRYLQGALTIPAFLLVSYMWIIPESVRWLLSKHRNKEALAVLHKVFQFNKISIPSQPKIIIDDTLKQHIPSLPAVAEPRKVEKKIAVMDIMKYPNMRNRTLNLFFCWTVVTITYFGLSSNAANLGGDFFVNFIGTMLIEIPSYIFAYIIINRIGRRFSLSFTLLIGGLACIGSGVIPTDYELAIMILSLVGKFGISSAFGVIFVYSAELFPTECRSVGVGSCSTFARFGGILAPYIANLAHWYKPLPFLIFGSLAIASGILVNLLPETSGTDLTQTLEECERFTPKKNNFQMCCSKSSQEESCATSNS